MNCQTAAIFVQLPAQAQQIEGESGLLPENTDILR